MPPDTVPPPPPPPDGEPAAAPPEPDGPLRFVWFDGLMEGPRPEDVDGLRAAVLRLNRARLGEVELTVEGGRFTILMDGQAIPGTRVDEAKRSEFAQGLQDLLTLLADGATVESTVRCTEVFQAETRETLFAAIGRTLKSVARVRPVSAQDLDRDPESRQVVPPVALSRRALVAIGVLFLVGVFLVAWKAGYLDRLFGTGADDLAHEYGPFASLLDVEVKPSFGRYKVKITRGSGYPATKDDVERLKAGAPTQADVTAVNIVANGEAVWVRLENDAGKVLVAERVELRKLISSEDAEISVQIDGKIGAKTLRLALDEGE